MRRHARLAGSRRVLPRLLLLLSLTTAVVLLLAPVADGIRLAPADDAKLVARGGRREKLLQEEEEQEAARATAGSSLPDCTHACGACSPCTRVTVSFKCPVAEPVPCPTVYRCMCRGKCYPVPSGERASVGGGGAGRR